MFASIKDYKLHYEVAGSEESPSVVFIHGLGASVKTWSGQAERLSSRFRVLRYDIRCHGRSDSVDVPCCLSDLAGELVALLDVLSIETAVLVGHSAGGVIAMQAALDHPDRVTALALIGTSSECNDKAAAWYARAADVAEAEGRGAALKSFGLPGDSGPGSDDKSFHHLPRAIMKLNAEPLTERLRSLALPTLLIVGEKDFLGVGGSVIVSRAIKGSELEIVPDRGHSIYLEDPDWTANRLTAFLDAAL